MTQVTETGDRTVLSNSPSSPRSCSQPQSGEHTRLRRTGAGRERRHLLLIPDLDDQLTGALAQAEELLLAVAAWSVDDPGSARPGSSAGPAALAAVRRLSDAIVPTQGRHAAASGACRIFSPQGRYEHLPLRVAPVAWSDIAALVAVAVSVGGESPDAHIFLALAESALCTYGVSDDQARGAVAATAAHLAALLSLKPDRDTLYLTALIRHSPAGDIILSPAAEAAYQRYATRASIAWAPGDPLHRWLY